MKELTSLCGKNDHLYFRYKEMRLNEEVSDLNFGPKVGQPSVSGLTNFLREPEQATVPVLFSSTVEELPSAPRAPRSGRHESRKSLGKVLYEV